MGIGRPRSDIRRSNVDDLVNNQAIEYFEPQLSRLNLGEKQIENQNSIELNHSLEVINDAIKNPDSFGKFKSSFSPEIGLYLVNSRSDHLIEIGVLPLLLERKTFILERIKQLNNLEKIQNIRGLVKQVPDEQIKIKLEEELKTLESKSKEIAKEEEDLEKAKEEEHLKSHQTKLELDLARVEIFERRSKIWRLFLEKESASTVLGGLLLLIITICQLIAMFTKIETTQIVNNAFLLILGYFFGTTVSKVKKENE